MPEATPSSCGLRARGRTDPASLLGRSEELELVRQLLIDGVSRLLTLIGPAGVGKTRLALAVAQHFGDAFQDGVWFVDLSSLRDPAAVPSAIAQSLGLPDAGPDAPLERLATYLRLRTALLILDNVEQVLPAAPLLGMLLDRTRNLRLLVTSRESLHLRVEQTLPISPLALPDPEHLPRLDHLTQVAAVALFVQRAQMINPGFRLTEENARAVAELVVRLDGLPLAIELAAARTQLLSPQMLLDRLAQRLSLLHWEAQDLPERQQTLRAAIAWSYDLLSPDEQRLFRHLGVFSGSFTLEAVEAIGEDIGEPELEFNAVDGLSSLIDKSLVRVHLTEDGAVCYSLLESIREYALARLTEAEELDAAGCTHALYYLALAERAAPEVLGPQQREWVRSVEEAQANLRAALHWLLDHGEVQLALRLASALGSFWEARGYIAEGRRQLEETLERAPDADPRLRARALSRLGGLLVWIDSEAERAMVVLNEALDLARTLQDTETVARTLRSMGMLARHSEEWDQARRYLEEALTYWEDSGNTFGTAYATLHLGAMELRQGNYQEATRLLEASAAQSREVGDVSTQGVALVWLVFAAGEQGDVPRAAADLQELHKLSDESQNRRLLYLCGVGVAWLLRGQADPEQLARVLGAVLQFQELMGVEPGRAFYVSGAISRTTEALQARLGRETLDAAMAEGRSLSFAQMAALIGAVLERADQDDAAEMTAQERGPTILSPREQEVMRLVAEGLTNKEIAKRLFVSAGTVKTHVTSVFNKLGVDSRAQAVTVAAREGLLEGVTGHGGED